MANTVATAASVDLSMRIPLTKAKQCKWIDSKEAIHRMPEIYSVLRATAGIFQKRAFTSL
ncbi:hypothetical protein TUM12370_03400 [Salmonella enterica subsp. enterica serovar Choleraesuis]|nr:hypothetical protein TUM12370_03400 [Salmonella enterica subsp. enterica serovar Choleraesuis]